MSLTGLTEFVLHEIFLYLEAEDLYSLQKIHPKFYFLIKKYRHWYRKYNAQTLTINKNGENSTRLEIDGYSALDQEGQVVRKHSNRIIHGSIKDILNQISPVWLITDENEELCEMHQKWWKNPKKIHIHHILNYEKYLQHFQNCSTLILKDVPTIQLSTILNHMVTVAHLDLKGNVDCTEEDFDNLIAKTTKLKYLSIDVSNTTRITNQTITKLIKHTKFKPGRAVINFTKIYSTFQQLMDTFNQINIIDLYNFHQQCVLIRFPDNNELVLCYDELVPR